MVVLQITDLRDFVSQVVPNPETPDVDLERIKAEVEAYLQELLRVVRADLENINDNCCP